MFGAFEDGRSGCMCETLACVEGVEGVLVFLDKEGSDTSGDQDAHGGGSGTDGALDHKLALAVHI
jgi:hypothetical protein